MCEVVLSKNILNVMVAVMKKWFSSALLYEYPDYTITALWANHTTFNTDKLKYIYF